VPRVGNNLGSTETHRYHVSGRPSPPGVTLRTSVTTKGLDGPLLNPVSVTAERRSAMVVRVIRTHTLDNLFVNALRLSLIMSYLKLPSIDFTTAMTDVVSRNDYGSPYRHLPEIVKAVGVEYLDTRWELCIPTIVAIEYSMPGGTRRDQSYDPMPLASIKVWCLCSHSKKDGTTNSSRTRSRIMGVVC
jgi:hypothetical protein